jgi:Fe2+ transport system protein B
LSLGFDWRNSIALLAGFAAKEVVVAIYETLCNMGKQTRKKQSP